MGHYRSAGKPGARSFESNQPVEALVNFNFDMPREELNPTRIRYSAEFESSQKAKDFHVELPKELPDFLNPNRTVSVVKQVENRMVERIRRFAIAGKHRRVYEVVEFVEGLMPGQICWNQHLFGYGDRGVAFKLAKKLHETVQMYDFGVPSRSRNL